MDYKGRDNLDIMSLAKNYNDFLIGNILNVIKKISQRELNILDFGAAEGFFAQSIKELSNNPVCCVETDKTQLEACQNKGLRAFSDIDGVEDEMDLIYSLNVLEHIEDDIKILEKFYGKLKAGGKVFLYLPACSFLFSSMDRKIGHFRRYSRKDIVKKLKIAGFEVEKCRFADSLGVPATLLYMLSGNKSGDINKNTLLIYDRAVFPLSRFLDIIFFSHFIGKNIMVTGVKK